MGKPADVQLKDYVRRVKKLEAAPALSFISLLLSSLAVSKVLNNFVLNLLYIVNIAFFALIVRESIAIREKNSVPLIAIVISTLFIAIWIVPVLMAVNVTGW